jgi:hypothetical protein
MDLLACAGEHALHAGEREACTGAYADAQALQHAVSSLGFCTLCVYYGWMNSKAMAEGRECNV